MKVLVACEESQRVCIAFREHGETHNQTEWCRIYGICPTTVRSRMDRGMTFEEALKTLKHQGRVRTVLPEKEGRKAHPTDYGYKAKKSRRCGKCFYGERADSQWVCMYIIIHPDHHRRGCEAGEKCTRFKAKGKHRVTEAQEVFMSKTYGGSYV